MRFIANTDRDVWNVDPLLGGSTTDALIVGADTDPIDVEELRVDMPAAEAIDYYATVPLDGRIVQAGDTVLFGFRPQVFVTRGLTAGIAGLSTGNPTVAGIWSADGSAPLTIGDALAATGRTA